VLNYLTGKMKHIGPSAHFLCVRTCSKSFSGPQVLVVSRGASTANSFSIANIQPTIVVDTKATGTLMQRFVSKCAATVRTMLPPCSDEAKSFDVAAGLPSFLHSTAH